MSPSPFLIVVDRHPTLDIEFSVFKDSTDISYGYKYGSGGGGELAVARYGISDISRIAIDPLADYLAVVDMNGNVLLGDISIFKQPDQEGFFEYATPYRLLGYSGKAINTVDLKFDETHSWLGWLTDERLIVWSLKDYIHPIEIKTNLKNGNVICFDNIGKLLTVGTRDGIKFFDLANGMEVASFSTGEVTALYFTSTSWHKRVFSGIG